MDGLTYRAMHRKPAAGFCAILCISVLLLLEACSNDPVSAQKETMPSMVSRYRVSLQVPQPAEGVDASDMQKQDGL